MFLIRSPVRHAECVFPESWHTNTQALCLPSNAVVSRSCFSITDGDHLHIINLRPVLPVNMSLVGGEHGRHAQGNPDLIHIIRMKMNGCLDSSFKFHAVSFRDELYIDLAFVLVAVG